MTNLSMLRNIQNPPLELTIEDSGSHEARARQLFRPHEAKAHTVMPVFGDGGAPRGATHVDLAAVPCPTSNHAIEAAAADNGVLSLMPGVG